MVKKYFCIGAIVLSMSCTDTEVEKKTDIAPDTTALDDGTIAFCFQRIIDSYSGTACCVSGPLKVNPGDEMRYQYRSNVPDHTVNWEIGSGAITILSQDSSYVLVKFGDDFTTGRIVARGMGINRCDEGLTITTGE